MKEFPRIVLEWTETEKATNKQTGRRLIARWQHGARHGTPVYVLETRETDSMNEPKWVKDDLGKYIAKIIYEFEKKLGD